MEYIRARNVCVWEWAGVCLEINHGCVTKEKDLSSRQLGGSSFNGVPAMHEDLSSNSTTPINPGMVARVCNPSTETGRSLA